MSFKDSLLNSTALVFALPLGAEPIADVLANFWLLLLEVGIDPDSIVTIATAVTVP